MTEFRPTGFPQLPVVVKNLLIINALVFFMSYLLNTRGITFMGNSFDDLFALHYWASPKFRWWQMLTHMFMHGSFAHILFNMFPLWMFGRILENIWGPRRFLMFYLICGLGAALCHLGVLTIEYTSFHNAFMQYQQNPSPNNFYYFLRHHGLSVGANYAWSAEDSINQIQGAYSEMIDQATLGASGAVFGLLFAFGYLFPNELLYLYFAIPVRAKWFVTGYALLELFSGIRNSAGDNIAHFAHLGGMLFAFILLRFWKRNARNNFY